MVTSRNQESLLMAGITYTITSEIFDRFPDFIRGVVLVVGTNNQSSPPKLVQMLREAEEHLRKELQEIGVADHPRLVIWREAFRSLGIKPTEFRPSIDAMARRVMRGDSLPSINALVDIGNIISLSYLLPTGCHAIDKLKGDIFLRQASGSETFTAFGSVDVEHPDPGEFIFTEGDHVLTRRWIWRQSNHTLTELSSTAVEYNLDVLPPSGIPELDAACRDIEALVSQFCGGRISRHVLSRTAPSLIIDR
jgi:DNA/RNA-binding domain of Phe-tRNA-synthetase-like protein